MAGYRTVDELMQILDDEMLMFDAFMSIIGVLLTKKRA